MILHSFGILFIACFIIYIFIDLIWPCISLLTLVKQYVFNL